MCYEGKKLPESRYLFALSCFRMNLLREAEETLCPVNEPNMEVYIKFTTSLKCFILSKNTYGVACEIEAPALFLLSVM
jgi:hypothetical protein